MVQSVSTALLERERTRAFDQLLFQVFTAVDISGCQVLGVDDVAQALQMLGLLGNMRQHDLEERMAGCIDGQCDLDDFKLIAKKLRKEYLFEQQRVSLERLTANNKKVCGTWHVVHPAPF